MEECIELLIQKQLSNTERIKRFGMIIGGVLLIILLIFLTLFLKIKLLAPVVSLAILGVGYGCWYLWRNTFIEYEYTLFDGEMDIAKIIAQNKRKELISVNVRKATAFGKTKDAETASSDVTLVVVHDGAESESCYLDCNHEVHGLVRVLFSPDERLYNAIKETIPRNIR